LRIVLNTSRSRTTARLRNRGRGELDIAGTKRRVETAALAVNNELGHIDVVGGAEKLVKPCRHDKCAGAGVVRSGRNRGSRYVGDRDPLPVCRRRRPQRQRQRSSLR